MSTVTRAEDEPAPTRLDYLRHARQQMKTDQQISFRNL
jgi:hypothetical protein